MRTSPLFRFGDDDLYFICTALVVIFGLMYVLAYRHKRDVEKRKRLRKYRLTLKDHIDASSDEEEEKAATSRKRKGRDRPHEDIDLTRNVSSQIHEDADNASVDYFVGKMIARHTKTIESFETRLAKLERTIVDMSARLEEMSSRRLQTSLSSSKVRAKSMSPRAREAADSSDRAFRRTERSLLRIASSQRRVEQALRDACTTEDAT